MINVKVNSKNLLSVLNNVTQYSQGFLDGIQMNKTQFNRILGGYTAEVLGEYIDSKARLNPSSLHHVYEWEKVGEKGSRLFKINVVAKQNIITFEGSFLPSKTNTPDSGQIFRDKANIMENKISVTVAPKNSSTLVFEDDGETIFTTNSIYIANPGGDAVAGSFGMVIEEFFDVYFTVSILQGILKDLATPEEFVQFFSQGSKSGKTAGVKAGRNYYTLKGYNLT